MTKTQKIQAYNVLISDLTHKVNSALQQIEVIKFNKTLEVKGLKQAEMIKTESGKSKIINTFKDQNGKDYAVLGYESNPFRVTVKEVLNGALIGDFIYLDDLVL